MKTSCTLAGRHTLAESIEEKIYLKYLHDSSVQVKHSHRGIIWWLAKPLNTNQKCFFEKGAFKINKTIYVYRSVGIYATKINSCPEKERQGET